MGHPFIRRYGTYLTNPHEPRFGLTGSNARREPRRMVTLIRKASNKAVGPVRRNPNGKRLCARSAASLVARVKRPHSAPRSLHLISQWQLRGPAGW